MADKAMKRSKTDTKECAEYAEAVSNLCMTGEAASAISLETAALLDAAKAGEPAVVIVPTLAAQMPALGRALAFAAAVATAAPGKGDSATVYCHTTQSLKQAVNNGGKPAHMHAIAKVAKPAALADSKIEVLTWKQAPSRAQNAVFLVDPVSLRFGAISSKEKAEGAAKLGSDPTARSYFGADDSAVRFTIAGVPKSSPSATPIFVDSTWDSGLQGLVESMLQPKLSGSKPTPYTLYRVVDGAVVKESRSVSAEEKEEGRAERSGAAGSSASSAEASASAGGSSGEEVATSCVVSGLKHTAAAVLLALLPEYLDVLTFELRGRGGNNNLVISITAATTGVTRTAGDDGGEAADSAQLAAEERAKGLRALEAARKDALAVQEAVEAGGLKGPSDMPGRLARHLGKAPYSDTLPFPPPLRKAGVKELLLKIQQGHVVYAQYSGEDIVVSALDEPSLLAALAAMQEAAGAFPDLKAAAHRVAAARLIKADKAMHKAREQEEKKQAREAEEEAAKAAAGKEVAEKRGAGTDGAGGRPMAGGR